MSECADVYSDEATKLSLLGSPADAVSNLTHAMSLRPDDPNLYMRRGAARRQNGQLLEAARDLETAIRKSGGKHPECQRLLVLTFNDLGVQLAAQKKYADAIGWLHRAVSLDETVGQFFLNRGDCHRAMGDVESALADFERAAELFVGDAKSQWAIQSRIALVHNERGAQLFNYAAARHAAAEFSRAIECNPKVGHFYINRAKATLELKRYDLARTTSSLHSSSIPTTRPRSACCRACRADRVAAQHVERWRVAVRARASACDTKWTGCLVLRNIV